jgi:hypothetical protein
MSRRPDEEEDEVFVVLDGKYARAILAALTTEPRCLRLNSTQL